ncbi:MAG: hypothetical protein MI923_20340 [Phycisphaerales bacterium]|nr:hypothetical protein [Phycisphaerales bacterium]
MAFARGLSLRRRARSVRTSRIARATSAQKWARFCHFALGESTSLIYAEGERGSLASGLCEDSNVTTPQRFRPAWPSAVMSWRMA